MADFDDFSRNLLEESIRFLEKAREESGQSAYLHAALIVGFCALEGHINGIADDLVDRAELEIVERGLLAEREVRINNGRFEISSSLKMSRLEERIEFLVRKFSTRPLDKNATWWSDFKFGIDLRNKLTHPKEVPVFTVESVDRSLSAIVATLNAVFQAVYKKSYPAARRNLDSTLGF